MAQYENFHDVLQQMEHFGLKMRAIDLQSFPKRLAKSATCGQGGKFWYKLYEFERDGRTYLTGSFGSYKSSIGWQKVEVEWAPLSEAERNQQREQREAARANAAAERAAEIANAAASAIDIWRKGVREGVQSPYLERKQVLPEACRFLREQLVLRWPGTRPGEEDTVVRLVAGTLLVPLVRLDYPKHDALRGLQFIRPDGAKIYLRGFDKPGCCVRLGDVDGAMLNLLLVCEGYATGLTLRMATDHTLPVFVAMDAGNLAHVVPLLRDLYPDQRILVCADDDWKTVDQRTRQLCNPGRTAARAVAKQVSSCDMLWPVFDPVTREEKDTDFNDLHVREGLDAVRRQLGTVLNAMRRVHG